MPEKDDKLASKKTKDEPKKPNTKKLPVDTQFILRTSELQKGQLNDLLVAQQKFGRSLDFAGYLQGKDSEYLGVMNGNYYAKPFGNDSSNVQAIVSGLSYWSRVTNRQVDATRPASGYTKIKELMEPILKTEGRPHIQLQSQGEKLNFFNTLGHKYNFNVDKGGHRSSAAEVNFLMSNLYRKDRDLVIKS